MVCRNGLVCWELGFGMWLVWFNIGFMILINIIHW